MHSDKIIQAFDEIFNEKKCFDLCRKSKFIQRTSKLKGDAFIKAMILPNAGLSIDSLKGLCKRIKEFNPESDLSSQALCERINKISSSKLMQEVFREIISLIRTKIINRNPKLIKVLGCFNAVYIEDSTVAMLNEKLHEKYKGTNRGGNGAKAQIKIDVIYEVIRDQLTDTQIFRGNEPDQSFANRIIKYIKPNDLVIRDLGYFVLESFKAIAKIGAFFLSRLQPRVLFYLEKEDKNPLDLGEYAKKRKKHNIIEIIGFLGKDKISSRLIMYRLPQDMVSQRLMEANKNAKSTGHTLSQSKKTCLEFAIFVTNVPAELLSAEVVGTVYRLRWEIELIFKRWKGQLEIDYLKGIKKERIDCLVWSRLCSVLIVEMITGYIAEIAQRAFERELSVVKLINYILRGSSLCIAIKINKLESFFYEMEKDIPRMLLKDKRLRKTMRERICSLESYYNIQDPKDQRVA